jgi:preprotein translocase subunit YajC
MDQAANPSMMSMLVPYAIIFLIFYFLVIKPQKQKQQETADMRKNIKKNDQVITAGGIHGTVINVKEKTVILRVDDNVRIEFDKEAITTILEKAKE